MSASSIPIQRGQRWTYVGPNGRKAKHTVIHVDPGQVITWSDPFPDKDAGGDSWIGSPTSFKTVFLLSNSCE